jgi:hypothetical protein
MPIHHTVYHSYRAHLLPQTIHLGADLGASFHKRVERLLP